MTHIPDAAVQAAVKAYSKQMDYNDNHDDSVKASLTAAIPYLQLGYEVKQLTWHNVDAVCAWCFANSPFGEYSVTWSFREAGQKLHYPDGTTKQFNEKGYGDRDAAKAAAQADFERRVRECIVTKPVDVAAVRRQAFEEGFENGIEQSLNALNAYDDITRNEAEQGVRKLKLDYRALSAEPATPGVGK